MYRLSFSKLKRVTVFTLFLAAVLSNFSCDDYLDPPGPGDEEQETLEEQNARIKEAISAETVVTNFVIKVANTDGEPQPNTSVLIGAVTKTTDDNGLVIFEDQTVNADFAFITATKEGYEKAMKTITPSKNGITNLSIMLVTDVPSLSLDGENGGTLTTDDGVTLVFPEDAIVDASGNLFTGTVNLNVVYYGLEDPNFAQTQPGTLVGITTENESVGLVSEGMLTVALTDQAGNPLNIGNGQKVSLTMPASADGPETIALWHFNETYGLWVEEGRAVKNGSVYEFQVSHFSTYNLDYKGADSIEFCITFEDSNTGTPFSNQKIRLNNEFYFHIETDNVGEVCFINAAPGTYAFTVTAECGNLGSALIDIPTSGDYYATLDLLDADIASTLISLEGTLTACNGDLLRNKYFNLKIEGISEVLSGYSDADGNYKIQQLVCGEFSGERNATLSILEGATVIKNDFTFTISNEIQQINLAGCGTIDTIPDDFVITITQACLLYDSGLEGVTIELLDGDNPAGQVSYGSIKNITTLGADSCGLHSCNGLPESLVYFTGLEEISFFRDQDVALDLTVLTGLTNLEKIELRSYYWQDVDFTDDINLIQQTLPNVTVTTIEGPCGS